ncbi:MAG: methyltransferase domain-containing protein [Gemmatimonadales bacterium]
MTTGIALAPGQELLDDPAADAARVTTSLGNVQRSNRWFGGTAAALHGLRRVLGPAQGRVTLLDIGTGLGDVPRVAVRWAARRGVTLAPIGLERHRTAAHLAAGSDLPLLLGCAGALPVRDASVDIVLLSQVLHHLERTAAIALLRAADRVARRGVVVADLRRSEVAVRLFEIGATLLRFDADTRTDGITSVRRGYSSTELRALAEAAGVAATVERRPGFRLVLWWKKGVA